MGRRRPRVDELVKETVARIIERRISDPRLRFVTVTDVTVSGDTRVATVYYTSLDPGIVSPETADGGERVPSRDEVEDGISSALPRIQALLGEEISLRNTPSLRFESDPVADQAGRVERTLRRLRGGEPPGGVT